MPVSHDLYQDLHYPREIVQQRRQQDKALDRLLDEYVDIDNQVLAAESISAGNFVDEDLRLTAWNRRYVEMFGLPAGLSLIHI